ncbi:RepB family plasmid replication initiator protein [Furfurilactobacillus milii]|uniref:Initiator Rep protein WH1 domain-containing protein n=1 Tax=Furfurilactobacillus milii TaxID=2888272 RepID=A0A6N9I2R8_9LACO|nr:RepB family plasmid replication initiator protein [Furfurilactobacillus milii]MYV17432.1 hypothetical protein [Furfurilactobacillus milii]
MTNSIFSIDSVNFDGLSKNELSLFFAVLTRMHHLRTTSVVFNFDELTWLTNDMDDYVTIDDIIPEILTDLSRTNITYDLGDGKARHDFFTRATTVDDQRIVSIQLNPDFEFLVQVDASKWKQQS